MEIVEIDVDTLGDEHAHDGESFGSQAIGSRVIRTSRPLHTGEINPVKVGNGV
jgi:hypothetical protein